MTRCFTSSSLLGRQEVLVLQLGERRPGVGRLGEQPLELVLDVLVGQLQGMGDLGLGGRCVSAPADSLGA